MNDRHRQHPDRQLGETCPIHPAFSKPWRTLSCLGMTIAVLASLTVPEVARGKADDPSTESQLVVEIDGVRKSKGQMCLSVFESDRGFPSSSDDAVQNKCVAVTTGLQVIQIQGLKPGSYAVAVLHDANGDQKANRNGLGIPIEGFGFSRNPTIRFRVPRFNETAIAVKGKQTKIQIRLNHLI